MSFKNIEDLMDMEPFHDFFDRFPKDRAEQAVWVSGVISFLMLELLRQNGMDRDVTQAECEQFNKTAHNVKLYALASAQRLFHELESEDESGRGH